MEISIGSLTKRSIEQLIVVGHQTDPPEVSINGPVAGEDANYWCEVFEIKQQLSSFFVS